MKLDFEVRNLSEYPEHELDLLQKLMVMGYVSSDRLGPISRTEKDIYDAWMYRIMDAIKRGRKNEDT